MKADLKRKDGSGPGGGHGPAKVPRGMEVLIKKAAVDAAFRDVLLGQRDGAAGRIGLRLEPAEAAMLRAIPAAQLEAVVAQTRVSPNLHAAFMTYTAAVMLAALGPVNVIAIESDEPNGNRPTVVENEEGNAATQERTGIVSGMIPPALIGDKVEGVKVRLNGTDFSAVTDSSGEFEIAGVPPGTYDFVIESDDIVYHGLDVAAGFKSIITFNVNVIPAPAMMTQVPFSDRRDLLGKENKEPGALPKGTGGLVGLVVDGGGQPISSALVIIKDTKKYGITDGRGIFRIRGVKPGKYVVKASRVGYSVDVKKDIPIMVSVYSSIGFTLFPEAATGIYPDPPPPKYQGRD